MYEKPSDALNRERKLREAAEARLAKALADLQYVAMMTGVELDQEDEEVKEDE